MKKELQFLAFIIMVFTLCLLGGCSYNVAPNTTKNTNVNTPFDPFSDQYCFVKSLGTLPSMVSSSSGYYFFNEAPGSYLYYTDKATMKTVPLCNKPNCLHDKEMDLSKIESCNAYVRSDDTIKTGDLLFYDSNIYFLRVNKKRNQPLQFLLTQKSLDGTQQNDVLIFKTYPQYIIIHRGFLYYSTTDNGTTSGKEDSSISKSGVYRVPMNDLNKAPELVYENDGIYANIGGLMAYEDYVYFECSNYPDPKMQKLNSDLICYQIKDGKSAVIGNNVGRCAICGTKLVYYIDDEHKCICDLNGDNKKTLNDVTGIPYSDNRFLLTDTIFMKYADKSIKRCLYVYDLNGSELISFDLDKYSGATVFGSDSNYIFLTTSSSIDENEIVYEYWRIEKNNIANGTATLEKYYTYTKRTAPE